MRIFLIVILISFNCLSQHSDRFKSLVKTIERDSVLNDTVFFKNGEIKFLNEVSFYSITSENNTYSGESKSFYANGIIARHDMQDKYGHWLWRKFFNRKGVLTEEWVVTEIDTRAISLDEFFASRDHIDSKKIIKFYKKKTETLKKLTFIK